MSDQPDIVLVVLDTARADRFGCYGYDRPTTPTVDGLARDGIRVQTMVANGPWTLPSHASLFTGLYPTQHGCQWQTGLRLRDGVDVTLAGWLREQGYHTICATNNGLISKQTGLSTGFDRYAFRMDLERGRRRVARRLKKVLAGGDSGGSIVNRWIKEELRQAPRPTFLFVNYLECHWAYAPPRRFEKRVGTDRFGFLEGLKYRATLARAAGPWEAIARADQRTMNIYSSLYDGELANVDDHVGELIDILDEAGRFRDGQTLMIVTSDHGEHLGEHGLADHHASLDDHLTKVPFVAHGPGVVGSGERGFYELVDVFPSLVRLLGGEAPAAYLSERRSDLFVGGNGAIAEPEDEVAFMEWRSWSEKEMRRLAKRNPSYDFDDLGRDLVGVRTPRFKLVRSTPGADVLYDLDTDPNETLDVSGKFPDVSAALRDRLERAVASWNGSDGDTTLSETERVEIERHLEELGYI